MKKSLSGRSPRHTKRRKAATKVAMMEGKTASGAAYTIRYPAPKPRKSYRADEASQFGASEINVGELNAASFG